MPSGAAAEASAAAAPAGDSGNGRAATPQMTPPSDTPPSAPPAERHSDSERKKTSDGRNALSSDDDDESGSDASIDAFSLETVLSDARRDVTAVTGWGPDAALVALDGGCLLVLRREREEEAGKATASAAPSISTPIGNRRSVPTTTAVGSASTSSASALADAAYPWRLAAAHSHLASKRIAQLEVVSSGGSSSSRRVVEPSHRGGEVGGEPIGELHEPGVLDPDPVAVLLGPARAGEVVVPRDVPVPGVAHQGEAGERGRARPGSRCRGRAWRSRGGRPRSVGRCLRQRRRMKVPARLGDVDEDEAAGDQHVALPAGPGPAARRAALTAGSPPRRGSRSPETARSRPAGGGWR